MPVQKVLVCPEQKGTGTARTRAGSRASRRPHADNLRCRRTGHLRRARAGRRGRGSEKAPGWPNRGSTRGSGTNARARFARRAGAWPAAEVGTGSGHRCERSEAGTLQPVRRSCRFRLFVGAPLALASCWPRRRDDHLLTWLSRRRRSWRRSGNGCTATDTCQGLRAGTVRTVERVRRSSQRSGLIGMSPCGRRRGRGASRQAPGPVAT